MKIGIDISQTAYEGTGVAEFVTRLVEQLLKVDNENEYVLFFSSLRKDFPFSIRQLADNFPFNNSRITMKKFKLPLLFLDVLWNKLHIIPIEDLIGDVDVYISSDWVQPPVRKAKSLTILYDLIIYKHPEETAKKIVETQKRRLKWVKKECDSVICISESTKKDAMEILGIEENRLEVVYPGV